MSNLSEVVKKYDMISATCFMGIATKIMRDSPEADKSIISAMELATTIMTIITANAITEHCKDLAEAIKEMD